MSVRRAAALAVVLIACVLATEAQTPPSLIVQRAGPTGELAELDQANEIRIVFSEPMVTLGRIPQPVIAPFVRIQPAIAGSFRWSGTTILIFTPDPRRPLPYATNYQVTVDTSARAVSGRQLAAPYSFRFTTPIVRLLAQQDPAGLKQFRAKVAAVDAVARGTSPITLRLATHLCVPSARPATSSGP